MVGSLWGVFFSSLSDCHVCPPSPFCINVTCAPRLLDSCLGRAAQDRTQSSVLDGEARGANVTTPQKHTTPCTTLSLSRALAPSLATLPCQNPTFLPSSIMKPLTSSPSLPLDAGRPFSHPPLALEASASPYDPSVRSPAPLRLTSNTLAQPRPARAHTRARRRQTTPTQKNLRTSSRPPIAPPRP